MAQRNVTSSGVSNLSPGYTISGIQTTITNLKASMQTNKPILASDMHSFIPNIINPMASHNHTVADRQGIDTFGNVTTYGTTGQDVTKTSSGPSPAWNAATNIAFNADEPIDHGDINYIRGFVNGMLSHNHTVDDTKGATDISVALSSRTFNYGTANDADGYTYLQFQSDGNLVWYYTYGYYGSTTGISEAVSSGQWINMNPVDSATSGAYDVMYTVSAQSGTFNWIAGNMSPSTWYNLGTTRVVGIAATWPPGGLSDIFSSVTIAVQIRSAGTGAVVATATYVLPLWLSHYEAP
jgi:hypothetical protein